MHVPAHQDRPAALGSGRIHRPGEYAHLVAQHLHRPALPWALLASTVPSLTFVLAPDFSEIDAPLSVPLL